MRYSTGRSRDIVRRSRRYRRPGFFRRVIVPSVVLGCCALAVLSLLDPPSPVPPVAEAVSSSAAPARARVAIASTYTPLLDAGFSLGPAPLPLSRNAPLAGDWRWTSPPLAEPAPELPARADSAPSQPQPDGSRLVEAVPLPRPRPSDLLAPALPERPQIASPEIASPQMSRRSRVAAAPAVAADNRSFFEKLFGVQPRQPGTALAYAAPQDDVVDASRGRRLSPTLFPAIGSAQGTAVYDIASRTVHMPNGERLEAHSGLGDKMDDVRFAHVRMQGVTPPHVYNLVEREALFHGVRAIRLHPVGGSGAIHGRAGLLAHTYLLGPSGQSNGCVSFKDYDKFLQAFLRGEIRRLVVVASLS